MPFIEENFHSLDSRVVRLPVLVVHDAASAQGVLAAIIGATMTVMAIVLSVLLVALTLASMQFSPRILTGFVEDLTKLPSARRRRDRGTRGRSHLASVAARHMTKVFDARISVFLPTDEGRLSLISSFGGSI